MSLFRAMLRNAMSARMNASGNAADSMRNATSTLLNENDVGASDVDVSEHGERPLCHPAPRSCMHLHKKLTSVSCIPTQETRSQSAPQYGILLGPCGICNSFEL